MQAFLNRYATPLTTGLFLVSLVSGIALFFHWGGATFHGMHEWLSMVLIAPFLLHIWRNWRAFLTYFKRPPMGLALGASLAAAVAFAVPTLTGGDRGGVNPRAVIGLIGNGTVAQVAPLVGHTPDTLVSALKEKGIVATADQTLATAAEAAGKSSIDAVAAVMAAKR
ncbi:DUF4405 domain-containing protein [Zhengella mangrovi]|uniref:DUF4405 domain-containing protein n=1 Tax=Zhengella mangrovi TaxID=1982044 RepID=A0A2G1QS41_9HYPH|nr:DUF4405 domain-containing protein [Zhengella mangrovi]PHP68312.1 DUF4405 domain-containing protein [Zhengella mangrovi]